MDETPDTLIAAAESAYALVESSPREAAARARRIIEDATRAHEPEAHAAALHALGYAQYQLADPEALGTLRSAIRVAERAHLSTRAAFARRPLAGIYADRGDVRAALREIDRACAGLRGSDLARAQTVRLAVLATLGQSDIDLSFTHVALRRLEREADFVWQARLLHNRGLVLWNRGDPRAAADFRRSRALYSAMGARVTAAAVEVLLALIALSQDDVVEAIRRLDEIDTTDLPDRIVAFVDGNRGRVLLAARLFDEAAAPLRRAEMILVGAGTDGTALEERLEITRLLLAVGEYEDARRGALRIGRSSAIRGNQLLGARAKILAVTAAARGGTAGPSDVRVARQAIRVLDRLGSPAERMRARLVLARVALAAGQPNRADAALSEVKSSHVRVPVIDRIDEFTIDAMLCESRGDLAGGKRAIRHGLRQLDAHRSTLGSVELRAAASGAGVELSLRGLRMAARSSNAREMLSWAEALRSNSLRLPALKPTTDARLSARQVELRRVITRIREADARGLPRQRLARRQTELEGEIRARTRTMQGDGALSTSGSSLRPVQQSLGDRALVEYVELDGRMHALTLTRAKLQLHDLGEATHGQELEWLRFALRRLARGGLSASARAAALANATAAAAALDRHLVEPVLDTIGEAPLVLVPPVRSTRSPGAGFHRFEGVPSSSRRRSKPGVSSIRGHAGAESAPPSWQARASVTRPPRSAA